MAHGHYISETLEHIFPVETTSPPGNRRPPLSGLDSIPQTGWTFRMKTPFLRSGSIYIEDRVYPLHLARGITGIDYSLHRNGTSFIYGGESSLIANEYVSQRLMF